MHSPAFAPTPASASYSSYSWTTPLFAPDCDTIPTFPAPPGLSRTSNWLKTIWPCARQGTRACLKDQKRKSEPSLSVSLSPKACPNEAQTASNHGLRTLKVDASFSEDNHKHMARRSSAIETSTRGVRRSVFSPALSFPSRRGEVQQASSLSATNHRRLEDRQQGLTRPLLRRDLGVRAASMRETGAKCKGAVRGAGGE